MYFYIISMFFVGLALSAPQDMLNQPSNEAVVYDGPQAYAEVPPMPETVEPYAPNAYQPEGNDYTPKEPEYTPKEPEYAPQEPEYTPKEPEYAPQVEYVPIVTEYEAKQPEYMVTEPAYHTEAPAYAMPETTYKKEPEYTGAEPAVVYELATEPTVIESEVQVEAEALPQHKSIGIISSGKHLSEAITAKIVGPIVLFNSKIAAAAGALPPMLAAKGAVIGSAIATPIEVGAVAGSSLVSGVTGKLVAIPISVGVGAVAKFVDAAEEGKHIWDFNIEHGGEIIKNGLIRMGHMILKPVAVVVGAKTALTGAGVGVFGTGVKGFGVGMEAVGAKMVTSGLVAKGLGHRLIAKNLPPYVK